MLGARHAPPTLLARSVAVGVSLVCAVACAGNGADTLRGSVVHAAVAANFAATHAELARRFEASTGHRIETSLGATGQLYAQIVNGAPYDLFLAADTARPLLLEADGFTAPGTRFTYAIGRLALYAPGRDPGSGHEAILRSGDIVHLAIANPETAPYGAAARDVLRRWGLWDGLVNRTVRGEDVGQTLQFVESRAAEAGFVALSQLSNRSSRDYWVVPEDTYHPIRQDAVLLLRGAENEGALAFLAFLQGSAGKTVITEFGYGIP